MEYIKIKTTSPSGDLISMLAGVKEICQNQNKKAIIYQRINMNGIAYEGAQHPYNDENGHPVTMNMNTFLMLKPLLHAQEYIADFLVYHGEEWNLDFDRCMLEIYTGVPKGSLARYLFHVYPQCATDLSEKWLHAPLDVHKEIEYDDKYEDKIIINITQRYRNFIIDYHFLKGHENKLIFAGLPHEQEKFCQEFGLEIPLLVVTDFLELAYILSKCRFFIGNQSFCFWLCEAMKVPRMLELFPLVPNVVPIGEHAYDYYHNDEARYYFNKLLNL